MVIKHAIGQHFSEPWAQHLSYCWRHGLAAENAAGSRRRLLLRCPPLFVIEFGGATLSGADGLNGGGSRYMYMYMYMYLPKHPGNIYITCTCKVDSHDIVCYRDMGCGPAKPSNTRSPPSTALPPTVASGGVGYKSGGAATDDASASASSPPPTRETIEIVADGVRTGCDAFKVDVTADTFGTCVCGLPRRAHSTAARSARSRSRNSFGDAWIEGATHSDPRACDDFRTDVTHPTFGTCICGSARSAHSVLPCVLERRCR